MWWYGSGEGAGPMTVETVSCDALLSSLPSMYDSAPPWPCIAPAVETDGATDGTYTNELLVLRRLPDRLTCFVCPWYPGENTPSSTGRADKVEYELCAPPAPAPLVDGLVGRCSIAGIVDAFLLVVPRRTTRMKDTRLLFLPAFLPSTNAFLYSPGTISSHKTHRPPSVPRTSRSPLGAAWAFHCRSAKLLSLSSSLAQPPFTRMSAHASKNRASTRTRPSSLAVVSYGNGGRAASSARRRAAVAWAWVGPSRTLAEMVWWKMRSVGANVSRPPKPLSVKVLCEVHGAVIS